MVLVASAVLASAFSFWSTLYTNDHGSSWSLGRCPRHASACVCFGKNFLSCVLAWFALGIWYITSVVLVSGSECSGRLGVAEEYGKCDSSGDVYFCGCNTWFDSEYMLCVGTLVALDIFQRFSTMRRTRILKCCSHFEEKRAQSMLLDAVLLCAARIWKLGSPFHELHVPAMRDEG